MYTSFMSSFRVLEDIKVFIAGSGIICMSEAYLPKITLKDVGRHAQTFAYILGEHRIRSPEDVARLRGSSLAVRHHEGCVLLDPMSGLGPNESCVATYFLTYPRPSIEARIIPINHCVELRVSTDILLPGYQPCSNGDNVRDARYEIKLKGASIGVLRGELARLQ